MKFFLIVAMLLATQISYAHKVEDCMDPELSYSEADICMFQLDIGKLEDRTTQLFNRINASTTAKEACPSSIALNEALPALEKILGEYKYSIERSIQNARASFDNPLGATLLMVRMNQVVKSQQMQQTMVEAHNVIKARFGCP